MMSAGTLALRLTPEKIQALDAVISQCSLQHMDGATQFEAMFKMAAGMRELRSLITEDAMKDVMQLQNTSLGFRTDKAQGGYGVDVVKDCVIEASLRGLRPVGNEFNIISGRLYVTKEGLSRLVREYPGVTDLRLSPAVPVMRNGGAIVLYKATWNLDGKTQSLEREFPVRVNSGMGADAIIGKATRKMLAAIYGQLTGSEHALPEGEVGDVIDGDAMPTRTATSGVTDMLPTPTRTAPEPPRPTPDDVDADLVERFRATLAGCKDADAIEAAIQSTQALGDVNEATWKAIDGAVAARRAELSPAPKGKQKALVN
jgi:hypothetical protein